MLQNRLIPMLVMLLMLSAMVPTNEMSSLPEEVVEMHVPANLETYKLYLDEPSNSGGDGALTTIEPDGAHKEASILGGVEFRSEDLISDLTIYGEGSATKVHFYVYLQFKGQDQSTADLTFTLNAVGGATFTETKTLDDPCNSGFLNNDCSWTINEVFFDVPSDGFVVDKGAQLRLQIDGSASCEGQGGIGQSGECDVLIAFGDVEQTDGFSRLVLKANALADSSVKVHATGGSWTDAEKLEWAPNHLPEYRTIQFSVDVRDAFGRDDIQSVSLVLSTPSGTNTVFDKEFEDDDLRLDNNGLVGNYTWTYDAGIASGQYPLQLEIVDVQGHTVVYNHPGIEFVEFDIFLSLPANQPDVVLIAPGQVSSIELKVEHTGAAAVSMDVVFELFTTLPSGWSDPIWDQPGGYTLNGGSAFARPILNIEAPEGDLSTAPDRLEIRAHAYAENENGVTEEVTVEVIVLDVEEVGVYAPPRLSVYQDVEHQMQIADSNRPELFDPTISQYIDSDEVGEFYMDVFNAGFDTDTYRLKVESIPDGWQYIFYDNDTGSELTTEGIHALTPDIGSHEILGVVMKIYPPTSRDDTDIGMVTVRCSSVGDAELNSVVSFTVHRTFGILAEVISDSDGQEIGRVGPVAPGSKVTFDVRITDSTSETGQNTWRVISPDKLDKNIDIDPSYASWGYQMTDDNGSEVVAVRLNSDETSDVKVEIDMRDKVIAGNHTLYLRVTEEVEDGEPRYFDLPLVIEVKEEVVAGRILVERSSPLVPFLPNSEQNVEFRIENNNNVVLDVIISVQDLPAGWKSGVSTSGSSNYGNTILLEIGPFETSEFSLQLTAPDDIVPNKDVEVLLSIEPLDSEVSTIELKQTHKEVFSTDCQGISCLTNTLFDFSSPQVIGLYLGIILVMALAVYRTGRSSATKANYQEMLLQQEMEMENVVSKELDDLPEPVMSDEDLDDDLELLEELDDLE